MKFYPKRLIELGEIRVQNVTSPIDPNYWEAPDHIKALVIDELFRTLEGEAFIRDYVILGPVHLIAKESANRFAYLVTLSAPMMRADEWEWTQFNSNPEYGGP